MEQIEAGGGFTDAQQADEISVAEPFVAEARAGDIVMRPDSDGRIVLPEGASLDTLVVEGRDLVIVLEDGTRIVVPDGAIIVPQLVVDGVTVPAANLAALLTGSEPEPAAGTPQSSGGNFAVDPGAIQAAYALGDLLPSTEPLARPADAAASDVIPYGVLGDPSVQIVLDGQNGSAEAFAVVSESGLPGGSRQGSDAQGATGRIVFAAPEGGGAVLIDGVAVSQVGQTFTNASGTLTITSIDLDNGLIEFRFELVDTLDGETDGGSFAISVTDASGDRAEATLTIAVEDDAPVASGDIGEFGSALEGPLEGNVLANDSAGADGFAAEGAITGFGNAGGTARPGATLTGDYGTLTLNADGSYSYVRFDETPGGVEDAFRYTVVDSDGSESTANLVIAIEDGAATIVLPEGEARNVAESQLAGTTGGREGEQNGSAFDGNAETATGTLTFASPDGLRSLSIAGVAIDEAAGFPISVVADATGTLVVTGYSYDPASGTGSISYSYTLLDNTQDAGGTTLEFPVEITDLDGDTTTDNLTIAVIDDAPEAQGDAATQVAENAPVTIAVLGNDIAGADGVDPATGVAIVEGSLTGAGTLVYNGDGSFTYVPAPGEEGTVRFDYTVTDGDGSTSLASVTVTLLADSNPGLIVGGGNRVREAGLPARGDEPAGSDPESDGEFASGIIIPITRGDAISSLVVNGVDVTGGGAVTSDRGTLTVAFEDGIYTYSYELADNTLTGTDRDLFTLELTDSDGDVAEADLELTIVDDAPRALDDEAVADNGEGSVAGNVLANDTQGADGAAVTSFSGAGGAGAVGDTLEGEFGTLVIEADGSFTYTPFAGSAEGSVDNFEYTITDGDGDSATATLTVTIGNTPVAAISDAAKAAPDARPMELATIASLAGFAAMSVRAEPIAEIASERGAGNTETTAPELYVSSVTAASPLPSTLSEPETPPDDTSHVESAQDAAANILSPQDDGVDLSHLYALADGRDEPSVDAGADTSVSSDAAGNSSFAADSGAAMMEALLAMEAPAAEAVASARGDAEGALAAVAAESDLNEVIDHFAAENAPVVAQELEAGWLDMAVAGGDTAFGAGAMPQDQGDEMAALAAAATC